MRWLPVAFLTNGAFIVTHGGMELTTVCCESVCLTTTLWQHAMPQSRRVLVIIVKSHQLFMISLRAEELFLFSSELCWGKAMVAYTMPQQRKKEESERLRGERGQIKFITEMIVASWHANQTASLPFIFGH